MANTFNIIIKETTPKINIMINKESYDFYLIDNLNIDHTYDNLRNLVNKIFIDSGSIISSVRNMYVNRIIKDNNIMSLVFPTNQLSQTIYTKIEEHINISSGIIFKPTDKYFDPYDEFVIDISPHSNTETIYLAFFEFIHNNTYIVMDLYQTTYEEIHILSTKLLDNMKPNIILDLDKTLILCKIDCNKNYYNIFIEDFVIEDNYSIMIRPGAQEFIYRLSQFANIYILTAADITYARNIITEANKIFWSSSYDNTKYKATIKLQNVFSVRLNYNYVSPKTFNNAIPLNFIDNKIKNKIICLAVDDNINAWALEDRHNVIQIKPFEPINISSDDLLCIIDYMERHFLV
jgi:hypothetical protein